jgi:tryptophan halogenase
MWLIESGEDGIKSLKLDNGESVEADLFVDCTGFKSLLLGQFLEEPFISYNDVLPNDRAWATHVPYNDKNSEMVPYTECTAIDNGWVWQFPLGS